MSILYFSAINRDGKIVVADDSEKGEIYKCISCNDDMILKKSGNTGPGSKRPHFAHKARNENDNCSPETVLHKTFKELLFEKIKNHIEEDRPLMFNWKCQDCRESSERNMLKVANKVMMEKRILFEDEKNSLFADMDADSIWRTPDISLYIEGKALFAIEIIVTHDVEARAKKFYDDMGIMILKIYLDKMDDIYRIDDIIKNEIVIDRCFKNNGCEICKSCDYSYVQIEAFECLCTNCLRPMIIPYTVIDDVRPKTISEMELNIQNNDGQYQELSDMQCNMTGYPYLDDCNEIKWSAINICRNCRSVYSRIREVTIKRRDGAGGIITQCVPKSSLIGRKRKLCWKCMGYNMYD